MLSCSPIERDLHDGERRVDRFAVKHAIEESARAAGVGRPRRRLSVEQMLAVGDEIAAMPLLDRRSPNEIVDDLNTV